MKEKLIRKVYHFRGMLEGIALFYVAALTLAYVQKRNHKNKPLSELVKERRESKEIH